MPGGSKVIPGSDLGYPVLVRDLQIAAQREFEAYHEI